MRFFSVLFRTFWHSFLESAETPLFVQIHVFAVLALRLDRIYTILECFFNPSVFFLFALKRFSPGFLENKRA